MDQISERSDFEVNSTPYLCFRLNMSSALFLVHFSFIARSLLVIVALSITNSIQSNLFLLIPLYIINSLFIWLPIIALSRYVFSGEIESKLNRWIGALDFFILQALVFVFVVYFAVNMILSYVRNDEKALSGFWNLFVQMFGLVPLSVLFMYHDYILIFKLFDLNRDSQDSRD